MTIEERDIVKQAFVEQAGAMGFSQIQAAKIADPSEIAEPLVVYHWLGFLCAWRLLSTGDRK